MTDIPEDIQQAARDVVHDYPNIVRQCVPDIERALLRERERCAQIAEGHADAERAEYGAQYSEQIADAIRNPTTRRAAQ